MKGFEELSTYLKEDKVEEKGTVDLASVLTEVTEAIGRLAALSESLNVLLDKQDNTEVEEVKEVEEVEEEKTEEVE